MTKVEFESSLGRPAGTLDEVFQLCGMDLRAPEMLYWPDPKPVFASGAETFHGEVTLAVGPSLGVPFPTQEFPALSIARVSPIVVRPEAGSPDAGAMERGRSALRDPQSATRARPQPSQRVHQNALLRLVVPERFTLSRAEQK